MKMRNAWDYRPNFKEGRTAARRETGLATFLFQSYREMPRRNFRISQNDR